MARTGKVPNEMGRAWARWKRAAKSYLQCVDIRRYDHGKRHKSHLKSAIFHLASQRELEKCFSESSKNKNSYTLIVSGVV